MKTTFIGVNEIHTLQYTYSEVADENLMYVGIEGQSNERDTPQDILLLFTKEQVVEMYEKMLEMEISNKDFLK